MRKPSEYLFDLLQRLNVRPRFWQRVSATTAQLRAALAEIAESREPAAIPRLIPYLFHTSETVALAASDSIFQLLQGVNDTDLIWLDEEIRSWSFWPGSGGWERIAPRDVANVSTTKEFCTSFLSLIASHRDGRVRQEAVRLLGKSGDRAGLPFLLIRVNDWVPNVRSTALNIIQDWLVKGPFDAFLPHLYLVYRLLDCQRSDCSRIVDAITERLLQPEHESFLLELMKHGNRPVARRLFSLVLACEKGQTLRIVSAGLDSDDVVLRCRAAQAVPTIFRGQELAALLGRLRTDTFATVRSAALLMWISHFPESAVEVLEESLLDRSFSVREQAAFQLRKLAGYDVAAHYRKTLLAGEHIATAILGLGESGDESDVSVIMPHLHSPVIAERKAAVRALARRAGDECLSDFLGCLSDDSPKVVRTAAKWLSHRSHLLDLDELVALRFQDKRLHVKAAVLAILYECETWEGLPHLIRAAADEDQSISLQAQRYIQRYYNRVFTVPSPGQEVMLRDAVKSCAARLDRRFSTELSQWLHGLGLLIRFSSNK